VWIKFNRYFEVTSQASVDSGHTLSACSNRIKQWCASSNPPFVLSEISLSGQPEVLQEY
jgi:hypothetical protein